MKIKYEIVEIERRLVRKKLLPGSALSLPIAFYKASTGQTNGVL